MQYRQHAFCTLTALQSDEFLLITSKPVQRLQLQSEMLLHQRCCFGAGSEVEECLCSRAQFLAVVGDHVEVTLNLVSAIEDSLFRRCNAFNSQSLDRIVYCCQ